MGIKNTLLHLIKKCYDIIMNIELIFIIIILVYIFTNISFTKEKYNSSRKHIRESYQFAELLHKYESNSQFTSEKQNIVNILNINNFEIYIIHMTKNATRLDNFDKYYNKSDIHFKKYTVFPAVVGKSLDLINFVTPNAYTQILDVEKTSIRKHHYDLTRGAVGCYLSHLSIYKKIVESKIDYGIIFEDDSIISSDFYARLQYGLTQIPDDWDIFLLGLTCLKCDIKSEYITVNRFWGTHGYIIKNKSAAKLVEYLDRPLSKQIDADLSLLIKREIIKVYSINPLIVVQDGIFTSDIQVDLANSNEAFNEEFTVN